MSDYVKSFCLFVKSSKMRDYMVLSSLILIFFFENCCRYLIGIARVPFIDYQSFAFSTVGGIAFVALYSVIGVVISVASPKDASSSFQLRCLAFTTLLFSIVFLCTAYATNMWHIILIRLFMGAMQSIVTPFSVDIISRSFSGEVKGYILGVFYSATFFAFAFSEGMGTNIYTTHGWKAAYFIFGQIGIAIAVVTWVGSLWFNCGTQTTRICNHSGEYGNVNMSSEHGLTLQDEGTSTPTSIYTYPETVTANPLTSAGTTLADSGGVSENNGELTAQRYSAPNNNFDTTTTSTCMQYSICQILHHWSQHSYVYTAILAVGVRLGAGFVWSNYSSLFFSPLLYTEGTSVSSGCMYSYNAQAYTESTVVCTAAFPYCVDSVCSAISAAPWHNQVLYVYVLYILQLVVLCEYCSCIYVREHAFNDGYKHSHCIFHLCTLCRE